MNTADYTARKVLDLSAVPTAVWDDAREIRLSLYFMVHDYSWHDLPAVNVLREAYEIIVNGHPHRFSTDNGAPVYWDRQPPAMAWYDFPISRDELHRGPNEILIHKAPGPKSDDYLYLGIDNTVTGGSSAVASTEQLDAGQAHRPGRHGLHGAPLPLPDRHRFPCATPGEAPHSMTDPAGPHVWPRRDDPRRHRSAGAACGWSGPRPSMPRRRAGDCHHNGAAEMAWLNDETPRPAPSPVRGRHALDARSLRPGGLIVRPTQPRDHQQCHREWQPLLPPAKRAAEHVPGDLATCLRFAAAHALPRLPSRRRQPGPG